MKIIDQGNLTLAKGILASGIHCGIKPKNKKDLALIFSEIPATASGVFTTNLIRAAPIIISAENLKDQQAQAIIINSGIANAATGEKGIENARKMAALAASTLHIPPGAVLVASTGLIGQLLPMDKIASGIPKAASSLSKEGGKDAAEAIMTTDTFPKHLAVQLEMDKTLVTIAGMAKGAGMIRPNMATMLAFLVTDADVDGHVLQNILHHAVLKTFNNISVDGDTSTNDMVVMMANGLSGHQITSTENEEGARFAEAVELICQKLSLMIVDDGEGATKTIRIQVSGVQTENEAKTIAFKIAHSPLVKTSLYGRRCNWGRVLAAVGSAGVPIDPAQIDIFYGPIQVVRNGTGLGMEKTPEVEALLRSKALTIEVNLHMGESSATVWTTDLSPEYVHINADYMS